MTRRGERTLGIDEKKRKEREIKTEKSVMGKESPGEEVDIK